MARIITSKIINMSTKKGPYRKLTKVEILKDHSRYSQGNVVEMHPVLAKRLMAIDVAKVTTKELSKPQQLPSANIRSGKE
jgi:hypothetical protein